MLNYKHILYAIDDCQNEIETLERVMEFAKRHDAKVSLAHVIKPITDVYIYASGYMSQQLQKEIQESATTSIHKLAKHVSLPETNVHILLGDPTDRILKFASDCNCDAIILNGHEHNIFGRIASTADALINKSKCDVIVLKK
jgi:universal stress protein A